MDDELTLTQQQTLVTALLDPSRYPHRCGEITLLQTHISWVILTGDYVYKMKKVVCFDFLDYATLAQRRQNVADELRLNRRTAPHLYLQQLPVGGSPEEPLLGQMPAIEYLLKMRQFPQAALFRAMAEQGTLGEREITSLARELYRFHASLVPSTAQTPYDLPTAVRQPMRDNLTTIRGQLTDAKVSTALARLAKDTEDDFHRLQPLLLQRHRQGSIRDCHGDLHLGNIVWLDGKAVLFDCIEFNPGLRFIDTLSELAFPMVDLEQFGRPDLANRLLNHYLMASGDYDALALLPFYQRYRSLVRAKIAILERARFSADSADSLRQQTAFHRYLALAEGYGSPQPPRLIITRGLSGSGKSYIAERLAALIGAIHLRSDVERKRLHHLQPLARSHSGLESGLYDRETTTLTYRHLLSMARTVIDGGHAVIVDATFIDAGQRARFSALATELACEYSVVDVEAPKALLLQRLRTRAVGASDPSEATAAVVEQQLSRYAPLTPEELPDTVTILNDGRTDPLSPLRQRFCR